MKFFDELKRRNVIKATIAYIVVAWVLLQVISIVLPNFEAPKWVFKTLTFVITLGLPIWIIFSWVYEVTPQGLRKTAKVSRENSITDVTNKRLNIIIILMLIVAVGLSFVNEPILNPNLKAIDISTEKSLNNSIAVLPFVNMSGDIEQEYFADGLSEELINMFTRLPELKVIGRTSSFAFKGKNEDLREIGKSLEVGYLLEGSVRKSGNKIRITAQLINSRDGSHLWSETFDRNLNDIFEIQDEISNSVVNALRITLSNNTSNPKQKIINAEAYNYFLRGKFFYEGAKDIVGTDQAINWFKNAINKDSTFSLPWTYLGMCYWRKSTNTKQEIFIEAKKAAMKALELDPTSGIAAVNVAEILDNEYDFHGALEKIDLALQLEPKDPYVLRNAGRFYTLLGRKEESISICKIALKNDPIQRTALNYLIRAYYYAEQHENAKHLIEKYKGLYPDLLITREVIDIVELETDFTKIIEETIEGNNKILKLYANLIFSSKTGEKQKTLELLTQLIAKGSEHPYLVALAFAEIGENNKSMAWLEKAYDVKDKFLVYVNVEPKFNNMKNNIRFKKLIEQLNFPK